MRGEITLSDSDSENAEKDSPDAGRKSPEVVPKGDVKQKHVSKHNEEKREGECRSGPRVSTHE